MAWIALAKQNTAAPTVIAAPTTGTEGRFSIGKFGKARYGTSDAWTQVANQQSTTSPNPPSEGLTPIARPAV